MSFITDLLGVSDDIKALKAEFVEEILGSQQDIDELRNTVNQIAGEFTGKGVPSSNDLNQKN